MKIYLFNDWHNGDVITNRALVKELLKYDLDIALGSYIDRYYLVQDLPVKHVISKENERLGAPTLASLCPQGYIPINTWCGTFPDIDKRGYHNWVTIVDTFNRQTGMKLSSKEVPMIDFECEFKIKIHGRGIYVENGHTRGNHSTYDFNMEHLANMFPELTFYCTANPKTHKVCDCSSKNLVELSQISNQCEAIVGKGSGPFLCTYTEVNRLKPRAVMQFRAPKFWFYRNNPLQYLETDEELFSFLKNVIEKPVENIGEIHAKPI